MKKMKVHKNIYKIIVTLKIETFKKAAINGN